MMCILDPWATPDEERSRWEEISREVIRTPALFVHFAFPTWATRPDKIEEFQRFVAERAGAR